VVSACSGSTSIHRLASQPGVARCARAAGARSLYDHIADGVGEGGASLTPWGSSPSTSSSSSPLLPFVGVGGSSAVVDCRATLRPMLADTA